MRTPRPLPGDVRQACSAPDLRTCPALRHTVHGDTIRQELVVLDVTTGHWTAVLPSQELPRLGVQDVLANRHRLTSFHYPDTHSPDRLICVVEHASAEFCIDPTDACGRLEQRGRRLSDRRSTAGGRRAALGTRRRARLAVRADGAAARRAVYRLGKSGVELVNSFAWAGALGDPVWLGNDRLLYRKRIKSGLLSDRGELWSLDIDNGQQRPFFAGLLPSPSTK